MNRFFCFPLLSTLIFAGCGGNDSKKPSVYPVTGNVKMHGAPLANATVAFAPVQQGQTTAVGTTDAQGNFQLTTYEFGDGAAEGTYKIIITKSAVAASPSSSSSAGDHGADDPTANAHTPSGAARSAQSLVPPQYGKKDTTPLSEEVKASGNNHFELKIE